MSIIHQWSTNEQIITKMQAEELILERRSVRKFKDMAVSRETMAEIMELSRWSPSWCNYQIARYTLVDNREKIAQIAQEGVEGFVYNTKTLVNAPGVAVLSYLEGKSGKLNENEYATTKDNGWEMFDAGIACQTFCLAAYTKGVGTCIMGVISESKIAEIVGLPQGERVAAIIVYGYEEGAHAKPTPRVEAEEIYRFL